MNRTFEFRTESEARYKYWKKILNDKKIRYEQHTIGNGIVYTIHALTIIAEDDLKYENESEVSDWELRGDDYANLKYICNLLCIPYEDVKFIYSE